MPWVPPGATAVICVALTTWKLVASVEPKVTAVAPRKPDPVIVTVVPPSEGPLWGDKDATVGSVLPTITVAL